MHTAREDRPKSLRAVVLLGLVALAACACPGLSPPPPPLAFFALGDTGRWPKDDLPPAVQLAVGGAMARADAEAPAGFVLLLGDNFYPNGLLAHEVESRVRQNLIVPYRHFVARGAPIYAVLGNHDHHAKESPGLEATAIAPLVPSFRLVGAPVERIDLAPGVSFVFYDSTSLQNAPRAAERAELTRALREAPGPWIVTVAHHPLEHRPDTVAIEAAIAAAGRPIQLHLAGHIHDLRVGTLEPPLPGLQIVSGGGGGSESRRRVLPGQRFQQSRPGFARVALEGEGAESRLRVRLFAVSLDAPAELVADWSVSREGVVRDETR